MFLCISMFVSRSEKSVVTNLVTSLPGQLGKLFNGIMTYCVTGALLFVQGLACSDFISFIKYSIFG